jgi:hypothetical protein
MANNERAANLISNGRLRRAATIVPARATLSDRILILKGKTWTDRLKTDREATFPASASRIFNVAALVDLVGADLAVIASVAAVDALADSAAAGASGVGDEKLKS